MCAKFLLWLGSKNKVLKPYRMFLTISRSSKTHKIEIITLFKSMITNFISDSDYFYFNTLKKINLFTLNP